ncbi:hypothetical protein FQA39_LY03746 [Lamprigera yunnana]|nr:hypothetical protein FQA39_LY03746 [Lamprigera yunnana]
MNRWRNKVAIVTGASVGIGYAIAEKLTSEGVIVVGFARRKEKLEEAAQNFNKNKKLFYFCIVDLMKEEDILSGFKWVADNVGPVHILVNNAGIVSTTNVMNGETALWKEVFDTNVISLCIATKEAIKDMNKNNVDGHIVHINSVDGHSVQDGTSVYGASKFSVTALTEILRKELVHANSKIKITSISPGNVATDIYRTSFENSNINYEKSDFFQEISQCAMLTAEDVADSVMYTLGTPPNVQVHEIMIKPIGELG